MYFALGAVRTVLVSLMPKTIEKFLIGTTIHHQNGHPQHRLLGKIVSALHGTDFYYIHT